MDRLTHFDEQTLSKVAQVLGKEEAIQVITILKENREITDDEIANETGIRINSVRKMLYKLYDHSLVSMRRSRDEGTGWFIFYWRLQSDQLEGFILNQKRRVLEKLETRLKYEKTHEFYYCGTPKCERVPFENAVGLVFKCLTCGKPLMHYEDQEKMINALEKKVEQVRNELSE